MPHFKAFGMINFQYEIRIQYKILNKATKDKNQHLPPLLSTMRLLLMCKYLNSLELIFSNTVEIFLFVYFCKIRQMGSTDMSKCGFASYFSRNALRHALHCSLQHFQAHITVLAYSEYKCVCILHFVFNIHTASHFFVFYLQSRKKV